MPKQKDLKRLVRTRMEKTGESYTTARAQITRAKKPAAIVPASQYAALAGMSDDALRAKTGRTWKQWVSALDAVDAWTLPHRDIARYLKDDAGLEPWWSQTVTVGYERIRGLRDVGQRRGGAYEANKSRTYAVPAARLYRALADVRNRRRWLDEDGAVVRSTRPGKTVRLEWPDGTRVELTVAAKGRAKSTVAVQHTGLSSRPRADRARRAWHDRLDALGAFLLG